MVKHTQTICWQEPTNTRKYGPEKTPYFDTFHAVMRENNGMMAEVSLKT